MKIEWALAKLHLAKIISSNFLMNQSIFNCTPGTSAIRLEP